MSLKSQKKFRSVSRSLEESQGRYGYHWCGTMRMGVRAGYRTLALNFSCIFLSCRHSLDGLSFSSLSLTSAVISICIAFVRRERRSVIATRIRHAEGISKSREPSTNPTHWRVLGGKAHPREANTKFTSRTIRVTMPITRCHTRWKLPLRANLRM